MEKTYKRIKSIGTKLSGKEKTYRRRKRNGRENVPLKNKRTGGEKNVRTKRNGTCNMLGKKCRLQIISLETIPVTLHIGGHKVLAINIFFPSKILQ
jgi:hypothetical protein